MFVVQIWCLYLVNRLLYGVLPKTTFLTKTAEHDLSLTSITFDLGWPRAKFFRGFVELMLGEVLKISKRYSQPNLSYWRKNNRGGGGLWAPLIRSRVKKYLRWVWGLSALLLIVRSLWPIIRNNSKTLIFRYFWPDLELTRGHFKKIANMH